MLGWAFQLAATLLPLAAAAAVAAAAAPAMDLTATSFCTSDYSLTFQITIRMYVLRLIMSIADL